MSTTNQADFNLEIHKFDQRTYDFAVKLDQSLFKKFEQDIINKFDGECRIHVLKSENVIKVDFDIKGIAELECDRSLKKFNYPLAIQDSILYKFSDRNEQVSENIELIKFDTQFLDISIPIYELILVNIPLKKIHPDYQLAEDKDDFLDDLLVYTTDSDQNEPIDQPINISDPRWDALKKLKDTL